MWLPGCGVRAVPVRWVPPRAAGGVFMQGARFLSELWRTAHAACARSASANLAGANGGGGTERAAHLVDYVLPDVPVRQWVLTLPSRVRYALAWDHGLCRAVVAVFVRAVLGWHRRQARRRGASNGRSGAVVIVQRFGSALNLNVHLHALVLDGVFARGADDTVRFHAAPVHPAPDLMPLLVTIATRLRRLLARRGVVDGGDALDGGDPFEDDAPTLAGLAAASVRGVAALGPRVLAPRGGPVDSRCHRRVG